MGEFIGFRIAKYGDVVITAPPALTPEYIIASLIEPRLAYFRQVWVHSPDVIRGVEEGVTTALRALEDYAKGDINALAMDILMGYPYRDLSQYQKPYEVVNSWETFEANLRNLSTSAVVAQVNEIKALGGSFQDWAKYRIVYILTRTEVCGLFSDDEVRTIFEAYGISLPDLVFIYRG